MIVVKKGGIQASKFQCVCKQGSKKAGKQSARMPATNTCNTENQGKTQEPKEQESEEAG